MANYLKINEAEEKAIREKVREELSQIFKLNQDQNNKYNDQQDLEIKTKEVELIRKDEELKFYTEKGYILSQSDSGSPTWIKPSDKKTKKRKKDRNKKKLLSFLNSNKREISILVLFMVLLIIAIVAYKA